MPGMRVRNVFELIGVFLIGAAMRINPVVTSLKEIHHCRAPDSGLIEETN